MSVDDRLKIQCGPRGSRGKRLVVTTIGGRSDRDNIEVDSEFVRRKFRERIISRFGLPDDAHEAIENELLAAADQEDESGGATWEAQTVTLADIQSEKTEWLWDGYLPAGAIVVVDGDPGLGKSQLTIDLAARLSRGDCMPPQSAADGTYAPAATLILNCEDDPARTLRPRLDAAGADVNRIHLLRSMTGYEGTEERPVILPRDLPAIETFIQKNGVKLVVIDPFVGFLDADLNMNSDADIRRCLGQVATMAERTGATILLVRHLNKKSGQSAIHRGGGSVGISGAARAVFLVGCDPDDADNRVFACVKSNLAVEPPSLSFSVESAGATSRVRWGDSTEVSANQLLKSDRPSGGSKCEQAKTIIHDVLGAGPRGENEVRGACESAEISRSTYWRARKDLNIQSEKTGFDGEWMLSLPSTNGYAAEGFQL